MFFFHIFGFAIAFCLALPYIDGVETCKLTEAKIIAKLSDWVKRLRGILDCADFKGVVILELHLDVANGSCVTHQQFKPG